MAARRGVSPQAGGDPDGSASGLWIIDPLARTLEVHRREAEGYLFLGVFTGAVKVRAPPFDAIELELSVLWGDAIAKAIPAP